MGALDGRVAVITGAGRGIGRAHALLFAAEGAKVLVNDLGAAPAGGTEEGTPAEEVVAEITAMGGEAVANADDCSSFDGAEAMVHAAVEAFGGLDVLVNNAGILRDRRIVNMSEDEWDDVVRVHMKGHFAPLRHAARWWRDQQRAGRPVRASVINTSSTSGLIGNVGQANYGAAKSGIATLTVIAAQELAEHGVRVNCISPAARTRLTEATPGLGDLVQAPEDGALFDVWDPANVAPLAAWLGTEGCTVTGKVFFVQGGTVRLFRGWSYGAGLEREDRWTIGELATELPHLLAVET